MFEEKNKIFFEVNDSDLISVHITHGGVALKFKSDREKETIVNMSYESYVYLKRKMKLALCAYNRSLLKNRMMMVETSTKKSEVKI